MVARVPPKDEVPSSSLGLGSIPTIHFFYGHAVVVRKIGKGSKGTTVQRITHIILFFHASLGATLNRREYYKDRIRPIRCRTIQFRFVICFDIDKDAWL